MKKLLFLAAAAALYACGGSHEGHDHAGEQVDSVAVVPVAAYGEAFDTTGAKPFAQISADFDSTGTATGVYRATIVETCQKMGCWMTVETAEGPIYVYMNDHAFFVPKSGMVGKTAYINGTAYHDTVTVAMQQHYLEDANASQEEIDAITEDKFELGFNALGVMIVGHDAALDSADVSHEGHDHSHEGGDYDGD
ncbi:MAG: hypothetical protein RL226_814 [Bacteroidota bacterium]|jgi:hypothetical protein